MKIGAIPALRGYRKQFLYTLFRLLQNNIKVKAIFRPEGFEDLDIYDKTGRLIETVQVKDHADPLTFSLLLPFFKRSASLIKTDPSIHIELLSFGPIGIELTKAWEMECPERQRILKKFQQNGLSTEIIHRLFQSINFKEGDEEYYRDHIDNFLIKSPPLVGDAQSTFEILSVWIYYAAEDQKAITHERFCQKLHSIGRYLQSRQAHHRQWFVSILPIDEASHPFTKKQEDLSEEFHQGVSVRYEHIRAGLDCIRQSKIEEIQHGFKQSNIVIIHGASGQGKTALAYRYLHNSIHPVWRFQIKNLESTHETLDIAAALSGYAKDAELPLVLFIDVQPSDIAWPELVKSLSNLPNVRVLITIREEDWKRSYLSSADLSFFDIKLDFEECEALEIYQNIALHNEADKFLNFDDAWIRFGTGGPLLEFIYFVTKATPLKERLRIQMSRIMDEIREGKRQKEELTLLTLVSVASAYGTRLNLADTIKSLTLDVPSRTLDCLEDEYLLRRTDDKVYLTGLHPVRSNILVSLLIDEEISPWTIHAQNCLLILAPEDMETFLLNAFLERPEATDSIIEKLTSHPPNTWQGFGGTLRALIWDGVYKYTEENRELIASCWKILGRAWWMGLDIDLIGIFGKESRNLLLDLDFINQALKDQIKDFRATQTSKKNAFEPVFEWLSQAKIPSLPSSAVHQWVDVAQTLYWLGFLHITKEEVELFDYEKIKIQVTELPLEILAYLVSGLYQYDEQMCLEIINENYSVILDRFRQETLTPYVKEDGGVLLAHFLFPLDDMSSSVSGEQQNLSIRQQSEENPFHKKAMKHYELLAGLFPCHSRFGGQAYGHDLLGLPFDDTKKTGIDRKQLLPPWPTKYNAVFRCLGNFYFRPKSWQEYLEIIINTRSEAVSCLDSLRLGIKAYFVSPKAIDLFKGQINLSTWNKCLDSLNQMPMLPKTAVDEWGLLDENSAKTSSSKDKGLKSQSQLFKYQTFLKALSDYSSALGNFFRQSQDIILSNPYLFRLTEKQRGILFKENNNLDKELKKAQNNKHLPLSNFADAWKALSSVQGEFARLFSSLIDVTQLEDLTKQENDTFYKVWHLWYSFTYNPAERWTAPETRALSVFEVKRSYYFRNIQKNLRRAQKVEKGLNICVCEGKTKWEESYHVIWIFTDSSSPFTTYKTLDLIYKTLRQSFGHIRYHSVEYYLFELVWKNFVIVPLVRGKSLDRNAWVLPSHRFVSESDTLGLTQIPQVIPSKVWKELNLKAWDQSILEMPRNFLGSFGTMCIYASHLSKLEKIPETDELGSNILQTYATSQQEKISGYLQDVIDGSVEFLNLYESLSDSAKEEMPYMHEATATLSEIYSQIMPADNCNGEFKISLEEITKWADRLQKIDTEIFLIYLAWVYAIIELPHHSSS